MQRRRMILEEIYMKAIGFIILLVFYFVYIGKMVLQRRQGIQTDQIAKGSRRDKVFYIELIMKAATYSVVIIEVISIVFVKPVVPSHVRFLGMILGFVGDVVFALAVITMKDNWRAGIAENDKTEMVTAGIYQFSRNPAFLGFDLVYLGIVLMFFNWVLLLFSVFAVVMLHLQILQEEKYLPQVFGEAYLIYCSKVCRYLGNKR